MSQKPILTLDTAVPDRLPVAITVDGERQIYFLRDTGEYSARERKTLASLFVGIAEFERADQDTLTEDDELIYIAALKQVMRITMPDVPEEVVNRLGLLEHGRLCALVISRFTRETTEEKETPAPAPVALPTAPVKLRKLRDQLASAKHSHE